MDSKKLSSRELVKKELRETTLLIGELVPKSWKIADIATYCLDCLCDGGKIMFFGDGGSAADSQHLAAELVGFLGDFKNSQAAVALTENTSILTAISNDIGFEEVFSRQIHALGCVNDLAFALSTGGNSLNVVKAMETAKDMGMKTVALTGKGGGKLSIMGLGRVFVVPSFNTQHIQEAHIVIGHIICKIIKEHTL